MTKRLIHIGLSSTNVVTSTNSTSSSDTTLLSPIRVFKHLTHFIFGSVCKSSLNCFRICVCSIWTWVRVLADRAGVYREHHAKRPMKSIEAFFTDSSTILYTLVLESSTTALHGARRRQRDQLGSLLEDFEHPVVPDKEIVDPTDKMPVCFKFILHYVVIRYFKMQYMYEYKRFCAISLAISRLCRSRARRVKGRDGADQRWEEQRGVQNEDATRRAQRGAAQRDEQKEEQRRDTRAAQRRKGAEVQRRKDAKTKTGRVPWGREEKEAGTLRNKGRQSKI